MKKLYQLLSLAGCITLVACGNGGTTASNTLTLSQVQQDNMKFFQVGAGVESRTFMPLDTIYVDKNTGKVSVPRMYFNTTEVGLYLNILQLVAENKITTNVLTADQALAQMLIITQELIDLQNDSTKSWKGLFYWPYDIESDGTIVRGTVEENGQTITTYTIPSVDNSNLDFSLAAVIGAYQNSSEPIRRTIANRAKLIISQQKEGWTQLASYTLGTRRDGICPACVAGGWNTDTNQIIGYHTTDTGNDGYYIDRMANESRLTPLWMLLQGYTESIGSFTQMPIYSNTTTMNGAPVTVQMTWDGTMFQMLLPRILVREDQLIPNYSTLFNNYVNVQQQYIESNNVIAFLSASSDVNNQYRSFGEPSENECLAQGWCQPLPLINGTPHATAMVALENPTLSLMYFNKLYQCKNALTPYGLYDAIGQNCETGSEMLSLDQGMLVLGLAGNTIADYVSNYINSLGKWQIMESAYQAYKPTPWKSQ